MKSERQKKTDVLQFFSPARAPPSLSHRVCKLPPMADPYTPEETAAVHSALRTHRATTQAAERALKV